MQTVWVVKRNHRGEEIIRWPTRLLWRWPGGVALEGFFARPEVRVGGLLLRSGDRMVEFFYTDRWYSLFAVYAAKEGRLRGWYADLCRPARWEGQATLTYEDLALDLVVLPDGTQQVLDTAEFAALPLPESERRQVMETLAALQRRFRRWLPG